MSRFANRARPRSLPRPVAATLAAAALALAITSCGGGGSTTIKKTVTVMKQAKSKPRAAAMSTYLPDVLGHNLVEPPTYSLSVDGDLLVKGLRWEAWGAARAHSRGTVEERPASGLVDSFSGSIEAFAPRTCRGRRYYTEVFAKVPSQAPFVPTGPTRLHTPCGS